jgi:hypothetical protein
MMPEELLEHGARESTSERSTNRGLSEFKLDLGNVGRIPTSYHLQDRLLTARDPLILPGAFLKWYELRQEDQSIPECLINEVQALVTEEIASGRIAVDFGVGFVVLQYATPLTTLIVGSWHENQEFRETHYTRDLAAGTPFEQTDASDNAPVAVWDLAPLWQERQSWTRYLFANRQNDGPPSYLSEFLSSAV